MHETTRSYLMIAPPCVLYDSINFGRFRIGRLNEWVKGIMIGAEKNSRAGTGPESADPSSGSAERQTTQLFERLMLCSPEFSGKNRPAGFLAGGKPRRWEISLPGTLSRFQPTAGFSV